METNSAESAPSGVNGLQGISTSDKSVLSAVTSQIGQSIPELLTVGEVADLLGISTRKVTRLALVGSLPVVKFGPRTLRFTEQSLRPFVGKAKELNRLPTVSTRRVFTPRRSQRHRCTPELYEEMFKAQGGRCLICDAKPPKLSVDHDHVTGVIRGLLCTNCNAGLGLFIDSERLMRRAIQYLRGDVKPITKRGNY